MPKQIKLLIAAKDFKACEPYVTAAKNADFYAIARDADADAISKVIIGEKPDVMLIDTNGLVDKAKDILNAVASKTQANIKAIVVLNDDDIARADQFKAPDTQIVTAPMDPRFLVYLVKDFCGMIDNSSLGESPAAKFDIEYATTRIIREIGVPAHIKGYSYLKDAVILCVNNKAMIDSITKELYPAVAERNGTTPTRVERAIRHGIEHACSSGGTKTLAKLLGYASASFEEKPTNAEMIAVLADQIRLESTRN